MAAYSVTALVLAIYGASVIARLAQRDHPRGTMTEHVTTNHCQRRHAPQDAALHDRRVRRRRIAAFLVIAVRRHQQEPRLLLDADRSARRRRQGVRRHDPPRRHGRAAFDQETATASPALEFDVKDATGIVHVKSTGVPPQMFRENIGVVVEGTMTRGGYFQSNRLMVSHNNEYRAAEGRPPDEQGRAAEADASRRKD